MSATPPRDAAQLSTAPRDAYDSGRARDSGSDADADGDADVDTHVGADAAVALSHDHIDDIALYRCAPFDRLLTYARAQDIRIDPAYTRLTVALPRLDKLYWRARRPLLSADRPAGRVSGHCVLHHALHHLVARAAPGGDAGMGRLALLGEAIASSANLYFCLLYFQRDGIDHPFVQHELSVYKAECERLELPLLPALKAATADPFAAFRRAVADVYALSQFLLETLSGPGGAPPPARLEAALAAHLAGCTSWPLISGYDYHTFAMHTLLHCGPDSSPADAVAAGAVRAALEAAPDFEGFLDALEALAAAVSVRFGTAPADAETRRTARS